MTTITLKSKEMTGYQKGDEDMTETKLKIKKLKKNKVDFEF